MILFEAGISTLIVNLVPLSSGKFMKWNNKLGHINRMSHQAAISSDQQSALLQLMRSQPDAFRDPALRALAEAALTGLKPAAQALTPHAATKEPAPASGRAWRIAFAFAMLMISCFFIYDRYFALTAVSAQSAPVDIILRAPISGKFTASQRLPGGIVDPGTAFGVVQDDRADRSRILELEAERRNLQSELETLAVGLARADSEIAQAQERSGAFRQARMSQLRARQGEAAENEAAATARLNEAVAALRRSQKLATTGAVALSELEARQADRQVAERAAAAARQRRLGLQAEYDAAANGVFASDAGTDRSISQQTEDRLRSSRQDQAALMDDKRRHIESVSAQLLQLRAQFERRFQAPVEIPQRARVARLLAQSGETVLAGQPLAMLQDCAGELVTAEVTERVFGLVSLGQPARFVSGTGQGASRSGSITRLQSPLSVSDRTSAQDRFLAEIRLEPLGSATACAEPRVGRVSFDAAP